MNSNAEQNTIGDETVSNSSNARIRLTLNNEEVIVQMYDNPTSRDFLTLTVYHSLHGERTI